MLLLRAREWVSAHDIADRFGVSVRTVYRDIQELQKNGVPVRGTPGPQGGYMLASSDPLDPAFLVNRTALTLYLLGASSDNAVMANERTVSDEPSGTLGVLGEKEVLDKLRDRVHFDTVDWYWTDEGAIFLPEVRQAVLDQEEVSIRWRERDDSDIVESVFRPLGIVWKSGNWYLVGDEQAHGKTMRIRFGRIVSVERLCARFEYPEYFSLAQWWTNEIASFGKGDIKVVLQARGHACSEIMRLARNDTTEVSIEGGTLQLVLYVDRWQWLVPLLLSYAGSVYVLEPHDLRESIIEHLSKAYAGYTSSQVTYEAGTIGDNLHLMATRGRHQL